MTWQDEQRRAVHPPRQTDTPRVGIYRDGKIIGIAYDTRWEKRAHDFLREQDVRSHERRH